MAYRRILAAALFATALVSGSAQAQSIGTGCKKQCDSSFNSCSKAGKGDACLRSWHSCKNQCSVGPTAAAKQSPSPRLQARR